MWVSLTSGSEKAEELRVGVRLTPIAPSEGKALLGCWGGWLGALSVVKDVSAPNRDSSCCGYGVAMTYFSIPNTEFVRNVNNHRPWALTREKDCAIIAPIYGYSTWVPSSNGTYTSQKRRLERIFHAPLPWLHCITGCDGLANRVCRVSGSPGSGMESPTVG